MDSNYWATVSTSPRIERDMRNKWRSFIPVFILALMLAAFSNSYATVVDTQDPPPTPPAAAPDMIQELHLTPEQRQKIRAIREESKNERSLINQRLREANLALEQALDAHNPDEALIEQRLRDATAAQAASMRIRIQTEVKIRRVLTQEQLTTLRTLRLQARELRRDQRIRNQGQNRRGNVLRPNDRNGIAPLRRRNALPRNPRLF
jgi:periplasmic protein CpxP/Spy